MNTRYSKVGTRFRHTCGGNIVCKKDPDKSPPKDHYFKCARCGVEGGEIDDRKIVSKDDS